MGNCTARHSLPEREPDGVATQNLVVFICSVNKEFNPDKDRIRSVLQKSYKGTPVPALAFGAERVYCVWFTQGKLQQRKTEATLLRLVDLPHVEACKVQTPGSFWDEEVAYSHMRAVKGENKVEILSHTQNYQAPRVGAKYVPGAGDLKIKANARLVNSLCVGFNLPEKHNVPDKWLSLPSRYLTQQSKAGLYGWSVSEEAKRKLAEFEDPIWRPRIIVCVSPARRGSQQNGIDLVTWARPVIEPASSN